MNNFNDLGIKAVIESFLGDKISIKKIIDKEIIVLNYKIGPSKFEGMRLDLQIQRGDEMNVIFTKAKYLMQTIQKIPKEKFPFKTTIVRDNECLIFT